MRVLNLLLIYVVIVLIVLNIINRLGSIEHMTTDETLRNIGSIYNTEKMIVSNLDITNDTNLKNLNVTDNTKLKDLTVSNTSKFNNVNVEGVLNLKGGKNPNNWGTHFPYSDGENYIRGKTNHDGILQVNNNTNINGALTIRDNLTSQNKQPLFIPSGIAEVGIFKFNIPWNQAEFVKYIENGKYFKKNMPDGTILKFIFVNMNGTQRTVRYIHAVKYNDSFLIYNLSPDHQFTVPNVANDKNWRGNIVY